MSFPVRTTMTRTAPSAMSDQPVVLVTGALTGIGLAAARLFATDGAPVVLSGRHPSTAQPLAAELQGAGAQVEFIQADVRFDDDMRNLVDRTVERFGRLDIAVNNARAAQLGPVTEA